MTACPVQGGPRIAARLLGGLIPALLLALLAVQQARSAGFDAAALMGLLAAHEKGRVSFVETRHLALLDAPLESSGELVYTPPDRLERHTLKPREESAILDGDTLTLIRDGRTRTLPLSDYPQIALLTDSLRAVLGGDLERLERSYTVSLAGTPETWMLDLLPKDPQLTPGLRRIHLVGSGGRLERMDMIQTNGDRSSLQIGEPRP